MTETTETIETTDSSRLDKARGLLFGLALGDCLGAPFEGRTDATHADIVTAENAAGPLVHTDDTALALVLARHLAHRRATRGDGRGGYIDRDVLAREFHHGRKALAVGETVRVEIPAGQFHVLAEEGLRASLPLASSR